MAKNILACSSGALKLKHVAVARTRLHSQSLHTGNGFIMTTRIQRFDAGSF